MRKSANFLVLMLLLSTCTLKEANARPPSSESQDYRGWSYLVERLQVLGVDRETLRQIYSDSRMPRGGDIPFTLNPHEHAALYSQFATQQNFDLARAFIHQHHIVFAHVQSLYGVTPSVIAAILLIESRFGENTGRELVLNRLSRMATLRSPENIEFNYHRLHGDDPTVTRRALEERADFLEKTFAPEVVALITLSKKNKIDPLELRGSYAGAFGMPQFLPSSYLRYAVDGNGDGRISLFDPVDAIYSTANFLKQSGWKENIPLSEKRKVIWKYNKSDEYISAVLKVAKGIGKVSLR